MTKYRIYKKQEKRITKLMYRKGIMKDLILDLSRLRLTKGPKFKNNKSWRKIKPRSQELQMFLLSNGHPFIPLSDIAYGAFAKTYDDPDEAPMLGRRKLIQFLSTLPNKVNDSKVNKILYFNKFGNVKH